MIDAVSSRAMGAGLAPATAGGGPGPGRAPAFARLLASALELRRSVAAVGAPLDAASPAPLPMELWGPPGFDIGLVGRNWAATGFSSPPAAGGDGRRAQRADLAEPSGTLRGLITYWAERHRLEPAVVAALIESESGFDPRAVSRAGARGLMQLMDGTARALGVVDSFDPADNVRGGTLLLRQLLDRYHGDLTLALAAYNAGPRAVDRYGGVPPFAETQAYVPRVLAAAERYRRYGLEGSHTPLQPGAGPSGSGAIGGQG